jgi:phosphate-selective porin OprO and OprP
MKNGLAILTLLLAGSHALAQQAPAVEILDPKSASIRYDGGFTLRSGDDRFSLKLVTRLQPRWEARVADDGDDATASELAHRFMMSRARLTLQGHAFGSTEFKVQIDFARGFVTLKDAYLDQPLAGAVTLRLGQFKRIYSRHQLASTAALQLVERAPTDVFGGAGRDLGVALHNGFEASPGLEWAVGVFNGTGDAARIRCNVTTATTTCANPSNVPTDIGPMVVAHVGVNTGGIKGYVESDLEGGPLRAAAAVGYAGDLAQGESDDMVHRLTVDAIIKVFGLAASGSFHLVNRRGATERETDLGFHAQAGYMLIPRKLELAARYAQVPAAGDETTNEILGGLNWFFSGNNLRFSLDGGVVHTTGDVATTDALARVQGNLSF